MQACADNQDNTRPFLQRMVPVFEGHPDWFFPGDIP
jgi:hypothetical protein